MKGKPLKTGDRSPLPFPHRGRSGELPHTVEKNGDHSTKNRGACLLLLTRCKRESYAREGKERGEMHRRRGATLLRLDPNKQNPPLYHARQVGVNRVNAPGRPG